MGENIGTVIAADVRRLRVTVTGVVQGVGFRPFTRRLADELGLSGWVENTLRGVVIEAEGPRPALDEFLRRLKETPPPHAEVSVVESRTIPASGGSGFEIRQSAPEGERLGRIPPDLATCPECVKEIFDPANRRFRYPFTNCTHCGPRFSIVESLPYDRPRTTMKGFALCPDCRREYEDPADRRYHAQPVACPACGPRLALWDAKGEKTAEGDDALRRAEESIRAGKILAVKGLGGFQILCDARNPDAVAELRRRKRRPAKPFAVMLPGLAAAKKEVWFSADEGDLLSSSAAPIVLLARRPGATAAEGVAPGNPFLGVMLPYTPLHHLLLRDLGFAVVATSGNLSEEPICFDEREALTRLAGLADFFLVHDRPIARPLDDSVARVVLGGVLVLRRARGYAPDPIEIETGGRCVLAVGGQLKGAVALASGAAVVLGAHVGDLDTPPAREAFRHSAADLEAFLGVRPDVLAADLHPDYFSTRYAAERGLAVVGVQHHHAHMASCMAENGLSSQALGVVWDGTGFGADGTVWGGEFLVGNLKEFKRVGHFRRFRLPGGEAAVKEPRRSALGVLFELFGDPVFSRDDLAPVRAFSSEEKAALKGMMAGGAASPLTSSAGRLFDAAAALLNIRLLTTFEGQAAMELEFEARKSGTEASYPFEVSVGAPFQFDWGPMFLAMIEELARGVPVSDIAAKFHNTLAEAVVRVQEVLGEKRAVLSGGCFQNIRLLESVVERLRRGGFEVYFHRLVPPNDGGLALGQAAVAVAKKEV
jgi:hydrogenase maturation protein HypF